MLFQPEKCGHLGSKPRVIDDLIRQSANELWRVHDPVQLTVRTTNFSNTTERQL